jgi:hypothetical protein
MQTTFELNANEIDNNLFEAIKKVFKNKPIKITITESTDNKQTLTPKE